MEQVNPKRVLVAVFAACVVGMLLGSAITFAVLQGGVSFPTAGTISAVNVGVFADAGCTQNLTSVSWGLVNPGDSVSRVIYVKNGGNVPLTLTLAASGWSPVGAAGQIGVSWDRQGFVLAAGQSTEATLTLSVSPTITGVTDFSVDVTITGSG